MSYCDPKSLEDILSFDREKQKEIYKYIDSGGDVTTVFGADGKPPAPAVTPDPKTPPPEPADLTVQQMEFIDWFRNVSAAIMEKLDKLTIMLVGIARLYDLGAKADITSYASSVQAVNGVSQLTVNTLRTNGIAGVVEKSLRQLQSSVKSGLDFVNNLAQLISTIKESIGFGNNLFKIPTPQEVLHLDRIIDPINKAIDGALDYCINFQTKVFSIVDEATKSAPTEAEAVQLSSIFNGTSRAKDLVNYGSLEYEGLDAAVPKSPIELENQEFESRKEPLPYASLAKAYNILQGLNNPAFARMRSAVKQVIDNVGSLFVTLVSDFMNVLRGLGVPIPDFIFNLITGLVGSPFVALLEILFKWDNLIDQINRYERQLIQLLNIAESLVEAGTTLAESVCNLITAIIALLKGLGNLLAGFPLAFPNFQLPDLSGFDFLKLLASWFKLPDLAIVKASLDFWNGLKSKANRVLSACGPLFLAAMTIAMDLAGVGLSVPTTGNSPADNARQAYKNALQGFYDIPVTDPNLALTVANQQIIQARSASEIINQGSGGALGQTDGAIPDPIAQLAQSATLSSIKAAVVRPAPNSSGEQTGVPTPITGQGLNPALGPTTDTSYTEALADGTEFACRVGDKIKNTYLVAGAVFATKKEAEEYARLTFEAYDLTTKVVNALNDPNLDIAGKDAVYKDVLRRLNKMRTRMALMRAGGVSEGGDVISPILLDYIACLENQNRLPGPDIPGPPQPTNDDGTIPGGLDPTTVDGNPATGSPTSNPALHPPGAFYSPIGIAALNNDPGDRTNGTFPPGFISPVHTDNLDLLADLLPLSGFPPNYHSAEVKAYLEGLLAMLKDNPKLDDRMLALLPLMFLARNLQDVTTFENYYSLSQRIDSLDLVTSNSLVNLASAQGLLNNNAYTWLATGKFITQADTNLVDELYDLLLHVQGSKITELDTWLDTLQSIDPASSQRLLLPSNPAEDQLQSDSYLYVVNNSSQNYSQMLFNSRFSADRVGRHMGFEFILVPLVDRLVSSFVEYAVDNPQEDNSEYARKLGKLAKKLSWSKYYILDLNSVIQDGVFISNA